MTTESIVMPDMAEFKEKNRRIQTLICNKTKLETQVAGLKGYHPVHSAYIGSKP